MNIPESPSSPESRDLTGQQLGNFQLLRRLGQGAMADVYLAQQATLGRRVAIKVLKSHLAANPMYIKRFQREARAAASLIHANIVQIYEVGNIDQVYYIAQEYVEGLNLSQWVARHGAPDLRTALLVMSQVAAALAKAGQHGIVHRDIKPENIMLTADGELKVADFGLARITRSGEETSLTEEGMTMGTPLYMSPEQVEGRPLDPRSDIYSFGVTCYQMLAGVPPFSGSTALGIAVGHLKRVPDPLEKHRPDLPITLCRAVHKMLAKTPEARYRSALELLRDLRRLEVAYLSEDERSRFPMDMDSIPSEPPSVSDGPPTQRLDSLMKTLAMPTGERKPWKKWVLATIVAFSSGVLAAMLLSREPFLLADAKGSRPPVPKQPSAVRQWLYASDLGTERGWKSVIEYYPNQGCWTNHAKEQLAYLYFNEGNTAQAHRTLADLATLEDTQFRSFGLAGQCVLWTLEGRQREADAAFERLWPIRDKLQDPRMRQTFQYILRTHSQRPPVDSR